MDQSPALRNVLIVDDDGRIRDLLCDLFEGEGYNVSEAADGLQAWEQLTEKRAGKPPRFIPRMNRRAFLGQAGGRATGSSLRGA